MFSSLAKTTTETNNTSGFLGSASSTNTNVRNLQRIAQNLEVTQAESQRVVILDSDAITVRQTEVQIDVVVQAAIQLLAQLALRVG